MNRQLNCSNGKCQVDRGQRIPQQFQQQMYQQSQQQMSQQPQQQIYQQPQQQMYQPPQQHQQYQQLPHQQQIYQTSQQQMYQQNQQQMYQTQQSTQNPNFLQIFSGSSDIINNQMQNVSSQVITNKKMIGFIFASSQCGPCKQFTPYLINFYNLLKSQYPTELEIILVTMDTDQNQFYNYFKTHPWVAVPFQSRNQINNLRNKFQINGYPELIIVNNNSGQIIDNNGVTTIINNSSSIENVYYVWSKSPNYN